MPEEKLERAIKSESPEKQPENLETLPAPEPEKIERAPAEISADIANVEQKLAGEQMILKEARAAVGLPPSDTSAAINDYKDKQSALKNELRAGQKTEHGDGWPNKEETLEVKDNAAVLERETLMRSVFLPVSEDLQRLVATLRRRDGDRLSPLMDERAVASLAGASNALMSFGFNMKTEDVVAATDALSRAIGTYGQVPRGSPLGDNMESLKQVSFALRAFAESVESAARMVGSAERNSPEYRSLAQLGRNATDAVQMHLKRMAGVDRYQGGRW